MGLKNILNLFDRLIKKHSKETSFEISDVYKAFEELEVSLDKAHSDPDLDKVVQLGANCSIFILGKYYAKLDDCEVYAIATILTPTLGYWWFRKNVGWLEEWKDLPLKKIREWWATNYKPKPCAPKMLLAAFPLDSPATLSNPYRTHTTILHTPDDNTDDDDNDELDHY